MFPTPTTAPDTAAYLLAGAVPASLASARRALAGTGITFDDSVAGERTFNVPNIPPIGSAYLLAGAVPAALTGGRRELAGTGITFDDSVAGQRTLNVTAVTVPTLSSGVLGYTIPAANLSAAVMAGTWRMPFAATATTLVAQFDTATGPSTTFTVRALLNGSLLGTALSIASPNLTGSQGLSSTALVSGDKISFEVTALGGATGPVTLGLVYTTALS